MPEPDDTTATTGARKNLDLGAVRERLAKSQGKVYWRSLEEAAETPEFTEMVHREFPQLASEWQDDASGVNRRRFLQLMSASVAFGGLTACTRQPLEKIVPFVDQPEQIVPGRPLYFATAFELDGRTTSVLAESHMGRPTKIEGNPDHPANPGGTDLFAQASILDLYDPDRSQTVTELGRIRTWDAFANRVREQLAAKSAGGGLRLRILTGPVTSPTELRMLETILAEQGATCRWHQYSPLRSGTARSAMEAAFGAVVVPRYDFSKADRVVALDADFLTTGPAAVADANAFARRRRARAAATDLNRLYVLETTPTATGTMADHRVAVSNNELRAFTAALAKAVRGESVAHELATIVAEDLAAHRGRSLVIAGEQAPAAVQVAAHWLNEALGNVGETVSYLDGFEPESAGGAQSLSELAADLDAGAVDMLLIVGGNPAYDAPADLDFTTLMQKVPQCIYLGTHDNETAEYSHWHLPHAHYLESWGDGLAADGTVTLSQPLIEPLYDGRTAAEVLSLFTGAGGRNGDTLLQETWRRRLGTGFDARWRRCLHDGFIDDTAPLAISTAIDGTAAEAAIAELAAAHGPELEIHFRPDPTVLDGRFANNGWLQECPKPLTKLTWDNALLVAPSRAELEGLVQEQVVEITVAGRTLEAPVWVHPGQPHDAVTLSLGYGRRRAGRVGTGTGVDAFRLRTTDHEWSAPVALRPTAIEASLASTQLHDNIAHDPFQGDNLEGRAAADRHLIRQATVAEFAQQPDFPHHVGHGIDESLSLMPGFDYSDGHAWGMSVDLNSCTSCNACVIACQSENNIPVVGKDQVLMGREMHWIRIDRYYEGSLEDPALHSQPVMCMHCEQAPCEVVCPVAATVHSEEGLNDMVYNRCVGTRYCANNCPYKVRRFNFFKYTDTETPVLKMQRNPDVTVRSRGVMEKCSYCVQRISQASIVARREDRAVRDGEIKTACQQVCPTEAIIFGDINDATSEVAKRKAEPHDYGILTELGTRPRTTYLAKVGNPNPAWPQATSGNAGAHGAPTHG